MLGSGSAPCSAGKSAAVCGNWGGAPYLIADESRPPPSNGVRLREAREKKRTWKLAEFFLPFAPLSGPITALIVWRKRCKILQRPRVSEHDNEETP